MGINLASFASLSLGSGDFSANLSGDLTGIHSSHNIDMTSIALSLAPEQGQVQRSSQSSITNYEVPPSKFWSNHAFSNLRYLMYYDENSKPVPLNIYDNFHRYNHELSSGTFTNLALSSKISIIAVTAIAYFLIPDPSISIAVITTWSCISEYSASEFEKAHAKETTSADKRKENLREKVKKLYMKMAEELINQYCNTADKAAKLAHRNRRNSVLEAHEIKKIQSYKISEALLNEKLSLIRNDLLKMKLYDLHYDQDIEDLSKRCSFSNVFKSRNVINEKIAEINDEREAAIDEVLGPLKDAATIVCTHYTAKQKGEEVDEILFTANRMYDYYLKTAREESERQDTPDKSLENLPNFNSPSEAIRSNRYVVEGSISSTDSSSGSI